MPLNRAVCRDAPGTQGDAPGGVTRKTGEGASLPRKSSK